MVYAKFQLKASSVSRLRPEKSEELNKEYHQTDCSEHCYNYAEYLDVILYLTKKKKKKILVCTLIVDHYLIRFVKLYVNKVLLIFIYRKAEPTKTG